jgi:hypothetical protein
VLPDQSRRNWTPAPRTACQVSGCSNMLLRVAPCCCCRMLLHAAAAACSQRPVALP